MTFIKIICIGMGMRDPRGKDNFEGSCCHFQLQLRNLLHRHHPHYPLHHPSPPHSLAHPLYPPPPHIISVRIVRQIVLSLTTRITSSYFHLGTWEIKAWGLWDPLGSPRIPSLWGAQSPHWGMGICLGRLEGRSSIARGRGRQEGHRIPR